jgi:hypothetical protein
MGKVALGRHIIGLGLRRSVEERILRERLRIILRSLDVGEAQYLALYDRRQEILAALAQEHVGDHRSFRDEYHHKQEQQRAPAQEVRAVGVLMGRHKYPVQPLQKMHAIIVAC